MSLLIILFIGDMESEKIFYSFFLVTIDVLVKGENVN